MTHFYNETSLKNLVFCYTKKYSKLFDSFFWNFIQLKTTRPVEKKNFHHGMRSKLNIFTNNLIKIKMVDFFERQVTQNSNFWRFSSVWGGREGLVRDVLKLWINFLIVHRLFWEKECLTLLILQIANRNLNIIQIWWKFI